MQRLAQDLSSKESAQQQELEANHGRKGKDIVSAKTQWGESWMKECTSRVEKKNSKKMEDLIM